MEKLIIKKARGFYSISDKTSEAIFCLGGFLRFGVGSNVDFIRGWLKDPTRLTCGGNYSHVEKHGDKITIESELDHFYETPNAPVFELSLAQMNYILDRWAEALEKKPNKIIITKDDNGEIKVDFEN